METTLFVKGLLFGFSIAAPVGPIGILCIRRSLAGGWAAGLMTGLGAATADALYGCVAPEVVRVSSPAVAEATKILENTYRAVNIALVNDLKLIFEKMGIDVWEVIEAARTKPFGYQAFYPGPGWGGHCIPIDPFYLAWKAARAGADARFIELAGEVNREMISRVADRIEEVLAARGAKLADARVLVLGVAYKPDVDDDRESPALQLMSLLRRRGVDFAYSDPHVPALHPGREHDFTMKSVELTPETLRGFDVAVLVTDHRAFDYEAVLEHIPAVVDTRNAFARFLGARAAASGKVFKA